MDDLHRHKIDHITIPSSRGLEFGVLRRVDDVRFLYQGYAVDYLDLKCFAFYCIFHFRFPY